MGKMNKTISIDDQLHRLTREMPNFSGFVEYCLFAYANGELEIDWSKIILRDKEKSKLEIQSRIETRLENIEKILIDLSSK